LRPLLDESLELQTVQYLRSFRHDLRHAAYDFDRLEGSKRLDKTSRQTILHALNRILALTEQWNQMILEVRKDPKAKPRDDR
jgi:hypothetical protein